MGYRDDFYIERNIVGYTGRLGVKPTVYFENQTEYGRITQDHPNAGNIGRNKVRQKAGYQVSNQLSKGFFHAVEKNTGVTHKSRNPIYNAHISKFERSRLAKAIALFPNLKSKY